MNTLHIAVHTKQTLIIHFSTWVLFSICLCLLLLLLRDFCEHFVIFVMMSRYEKFLLFVSPKISNCKFHNTKWGWCQRRKEFLLSRRWRNVSFKLFLPASSSPTASASTLTSFLARFALKTKHGGVSRFQFASKTETESESISIRAATVSRGLPLLLL